MSAIHLDTKTYVDMWYDDPFLAGIYGSDAYWSDTDGVYRGNIYDKNGRIIGDYQSPDSTWIEKRFLIQWNN